MTHFCIEVGMSGGDICFVDMLLYRTCAIVWWTIHLNVQLS
jgi:hypothetical protein